MTEGWVWGMGFRRFQPVRLDRFGSFIRNRESTERHTYVLFEVERSVQF